MTASDNIDAMIAGLSDWRGTVLDRLRGVIREADPRLQEDWKWGSPVWTYKGNVCSLGAFKDHVKVNFFKGASIPDPSGLFNAGLEAKTTRSIDLAEGEEIDESALQELIRTAASANE